MNKLIHYLSYSVDQYITNKDAFKEYAHILSYYWSKDYEKVVTLLTKKISESVKDEEKVLYYRMWIEILAETEDHASLHFLLKHLASKKKCGINSCITRLALKGIIHLEIDEWEACMLLLPFVKNQKKNPYCLEFEQRCAFRSSQLKDSVYSLISTTVPLLDYFHWCYLLKEISAKENKQLLEQCLAYSKKIFGRSPAFLLCSIQECIQDKQYTEANSLAIKLHHLYPKNEEYLFLCCHLQLFIGDSKGVIALLSGHSHNAKKIINSNFYLLLAYGHYLSQENDLDSTNLKKSIDYLTKAKISMHSQGLFAKEAFLSQFSLNLLAGENKEDDHLSLDVNIWMVNLSPRRFYEVSYTEEDSIKNINYSIGSKVKHKDIVFFATNTLDNNNSMFQLSAAYQVVSPPIWSMAGNYQSQVRLIRRFKYPVQIVFDLDFFKGDFSKKLDHPGVLNGIHMLKMSGIKKIVGVLRDIYKEDLDLHQKIKQVKKVAYG